MTTNDHEPSTNDHEPSLWELLGLDPQTIVPPVPDDAWDRAVRIATDPDTPAVGADLIPADEPDDLDVDPVAPGVDPGSDDNAPFRQEHHEPAFDHPAFEDAGHSDPGVDEPCAYPEPGVTDDPGLA
ncbi:hypothetical protein ACWDTG_23515 [Rhodococcus zopfii]|uniref:hypothetical protein n=1 Tax=Rhodococcus zopfii TaxID=43772 RepID=UPI001111150B|nr:hypothetical protein [Rhodococcus zopfii]